MKAIKRLIITLIVIVAVVGVAVIGGYVYVRTTYDIDLFNTAGQLKALSKESFDEKELLSDAFSASDMADVKSEMDKYVGGLIEYQEGTGYNGYKINIPPSTAHTSIDKRIAFSARQAGAIAQTVFYDKSGGKINIGEKELPAQIVRVGFSDITDNGSAALNIVAKVSLKPLKDSMNGFPYSLFKKYVPDELYVSSTVKVQKENEGMEYGIEDVGLRLNNLSMEDTADLFHTLDAVIKIGPAKDLNMQIGSAAANALIGNAEHVGFVYAMRYYGMTAFEFAEIVDQSVIIIY